MVTTVVISVNKLESLQKFSKRYYKQIEKKLVSITQYKGKVTINRYLKKMQLVTGNYCKGELKQKFGDKKQKEKQSWKSQ